VIRLMVDLIFVEDDEALTNPASSAPFTIRPPAPAALLSVAESIWRA